MGRNSGYLALMGGLVCGAEMVLIPEVPTTPDEVATAVAAAYERGKNHAFIIIAEGAGLTTHEVASHLAEADAGFDSRVTALGHVQRGGSPTAFDRLLANRMGITAVDAIIDGRTDHMTGLSGRDIELVPLEDVVCQSRTANLKYYELMQILAT